MITTLANIVKKIKQMKPPELVHKSLLQTTDILVHYIFANGSKAIEVCDHPDTRLRWRSSMTFSHKRLNCHPSSFQIWANALRRRYRAFSWRTILTLRLRREHTLAIRLHHLSWPSPSLIFFTWHAFWKCYSIKGPALIPTKATIAAILSASSTVSFSGRPQVHNLVFELAEF